MNTNTDIVHSFSRVSAQRYGLHGALLYQYLIHKIRTSANIRDGKRWFYDSIAELTKHYPYLSQTAVFNARQILINDTGPLITANYNKWGRDKTTWYSVKNERTLTEPEDELLYFGVPDAVAYGILEAVIVNNLKYWLETKQKKDPAYLYHAISPRSLEKVFNGAFSRSSIQRALDHLVKVHVLIPKAPDSANNPTSYRFAGPDDASLLLASGGSTENEVLAQDEVRGGSTENDAEVAQKQGRGSIKNQTGSTEIMADPTENEVAQIGTKVAQPRTTLPINNSLKGDCLKEAVLKENHFKVSSVGFSSNSLEPGASLTSESASSKVQDSGLNLFSESIAASHPAPPDNASLNSSKSPPNLDLNHFTEPVAPPPTLVPASSNNSSAPPINPSLNNTPVSPRSGQSDQNAFAKVNAEAVHIPIPNHAPPKELPYYVFLDLEGVHKDCWEVMLFHDQNADPIYQNMAETIVGVAERLIAATDPAEIYRLLHIAKQSDLNGEIYLWFNQFFADIYDQQLSTPDCPDNAYFRELFLEHSLCFLNMAFHCLKFDGYRVYLGKPYHSIMQSLFSRMSPWIEQQQANRRAQDLQERATKYASPDKDKESDPNLSAPEKMQVFSQSLQARNRIGKHDDYGHFTEQVVVLGRNTLNLARLFFQLNPHYTVQDIGKVIDACVKLPVWREETEPDPQWHARNGYKISLLLSSFAQVAAQLNMLSQIPPFTPLLIKDEEVE